MSELDKLQQALKYKFKDIEILKKALTHKSCKKTCNNERLEFLGDAVMGLIVAEYLYKKCENTAEGDLSKLRAALVNEASFSNLARLLNLGTNLFISTAEENNGGREKNSLLSDAFEAIIGAIYLESGLDMSKEVVLEILEHAYPDINLNILAKDYKTTLQEITQARYGVTPEYKLISSKGPDHMKEFNMGVVLDGRQISKAIGKSKKDAEQKAAKIAIEILQKEL